MTIEHHHVIELYGWSYHLVTFGLGVLLGWLLRTPTR